MEITNKTLALLLVAAIAVTVFGTVFSVNKLGSFSTSTTGFATSGQGTATLNVSSTASLRMLSNTINFGSGSINSSSGYTNCTLMVNGTNATATATTSAGCIGFETTSTQKPFIVENDGNVDLTVTITTDQTPSYIGGTGTGGHPPAEFKFQVLDEETGACSAGLDSNWLNISTNPQTVCTDFNWDGSDALAIGVRVLVPDDASTGLKTVTFTVQGTS